MRVTFSGVGGGFDDTLARVLHLDFEAAYVRFTIQRGNQPTTPYLTTTNTTYGTMHHIDFHYELVMENGAMWLVFLSPAQRRESSGFLRRGGRLSQE